MKNGIGKSLFLKVAGLILLALTASERCFAQDPFAKIKAKEEAFQYLPLGEIKPTGWLAEQFRKNLDGCIGHLDSIVPDLIVKDDIYGSDRRTKDMKTKDVGNGWENIQTLWWNSETQGNWWDGYIRNAFLMGDQQHIKRIEDHVNRILATQDKDGYLGIYDRDLRYNFSEYGENGELWSKTTLYRGLLAYYGFTKDKKVLKAVERAVQNVMDNYKINASQPFFVKEHGFCPGFCLGLNFTDVLDRLHQITHNPVYWDYALFLYKDYSAHDNVDAKDVQFSSIMNPEYRLNYRGGSTYQHLRTLVTAYHASGNPRLGEALQIYLNRIGEMLTPAGGAIGDEWINGRKADPTYVGYEYCALQELLDSYSRVIEKTGEIRYADRIENLFYNASMGMRHPDKSAVTYLQTDNSYEMKGGHGEDHNWRNGRSYKYSPAHQDVAVCCVPSSGRIIAYYTQYMWLKDKDGLIASLLGSCEVNTRVNNQLVSIKEITEYPYSNRFTFEVEVAKPLLFTLKIHKPEWNRGFTLNTEYEEDGDYIIIRKKWSGKETLDLEFKAKIEKHAVNNEVYFTYGRLLLALPINAVEISKRIYYKQFQDFEYAPKDLIIYKDANEMPVKEQDKFHVNLYNPVTQRIEKKTLVPVGNTLLRQVTFVLHDFPAVADGTSN